MRDFESSEDKREDIHLRARVDQALMISRSRGFSAAKDFLLQTQVPSSIAARALARIETEIALQVGMARQVLTGAQIADLIAVQMIHCQACDRVSVPSVRHCPVDDTGCNWETWDWRGDAAAIAPCRVALIETVTALKAAYLLSTAKQRLS